MRGLLQALKALPDQYERDHALTLRDYYAPGYWAVLAAFVHLKGLKRDQIQFDAGVEGYASAMGFSRALWGADDYTQQRIREGTNYSCIVHLERQEQTDAAVENVNNCIRSFCAGAAPSQFVSALCHLVGDLHDNVWSHGMASGFSMAQKWKVPHCNDHFLEFAIADHGMGFLRELQRCQIQVPDDEAAIDWCVQEGNSTKKAAVNLDWAQAVPGDVAGNPLTGIESTRPAERLHNHHQGLGLYNLLKTVDLFGGDLWIASGQSCQAIVSGREKKGYSLPVGWQGVAISCRFQLSRVRDFDQQRAQDDPSIQKLMELIGG